MSFSRSLLHAVRGRLSGTHRRRQARSGRSCGLSFETLEDRSLPSGLLGLAQASLPPDFASGGLTHLSYTQGTSNANPFHYDAIPLALSLGNGSLYAVANPTGGTRSVQLNTVLNNNGVFVGGGTSTDFSLTGKITITINNTPNTFNGTLLTGQVRNSGARPNPTDSEFEVAIAVTGGSLTTNLATAPVKVGDQVDLLIHQPGLPISSFPQSFNYTGFPGTSDLRKLAQVTTNSNPLTPNCGCTTSDLPLTSSNNTPQSTRTQPVYLNDGEYHTQTTELTIPGRGIDWNFTLTYRSGIQTTGPLGNNWDFNYDIRLEIVNTQNLTEIRRSFPSANLGDVVRLDGGLDRADIYVYNSTTHTYTDPQGYFTFLVQNTNGSFSERDQSWHDPDLQPARFHRPGLHHQRAGPRRRHFAVPVQQPGATGDGDRYPGPAHHLQLQQHRPAYQRHRFHRPHPASATTRRAT